MGYTHYWTFKKDNSKHTEEKYQLALRQCQRIIRRWNKEVKAIDEKNPHRLSGYSAHTEIAQYKGIKFNGTQENGHEDFVLRETYGENGPFNFCKTARKPYDAVVVACLVTLNHYLKDNVIVTSDGDKSDYLSGLILAKKVLRIKDLKI